MSGTVTFLFRVEILRFAQDDRMHPKKVVEGKYRGVGRTRCHCEERADLAIAFNRHSIASDEVISMGVGMRHPQEIASSFGSSQ